MSFRTRKPVIIRAVQENKGRSTAAATKVVLPHSQRPALTEVSNKVQIEEVDRKGKVKGETVGTKKSPPVANRTTARQIEEQVRCVSKLSVKQEEDVVINKQPTRPEKECEAYSSKQLGIILDVDTSKDPLQVSEYVRDIYRYLQELETEYDIKSNFLESHRTLPRMRSVLVNWMVDVHINFKFLVETLHLSVAIVDRYLQVNKTVGRETLQLVGTAAMLVAGKYEEIYVPEISNFVYICDDTFSREEILNMEIDILKKLNFNLGRPLSLHFLRRYNKIVKARPEHHVLGKYLLELALIEYDTCWVKPSVQAAAAFCLSVSVLDGLSDPSHAWTKVLADYSCYKYADIKLAVVNLACALGRAEKSQHQAIRAKYAASSYGKISLSPKLRCGLIRKLIVESPLLKKKN